jgi:hypothetical protein
MSILLILLLGIFSAFTTMTSASANQPMARSPKVRRAPVSSDQIVKIFTSPTIATIIQVPDRPNSVVLGNQPGFQVEYLDTAVTIKPLSNSSKGNLYIYTDYRRYNVELITTDSSRADYIVYLLDNVSETGQQKRPSVPSIKWTDYSERIEAKLFAMQTTRIGKTCDKMRLIEFRLSSDRDFIIDPGLFWVTQDGKEKPIQSLHLSSLHVGRERPINGAITLLDRDFKRTDVRIEIRGKKSTGHTIPKGALWK